MKQFTREEHPKYLYELLHGLYEKEIAMDFAKLTPRKKIKAAVKLLEKGLHEFNFMTTLIYAYDYFGNPDMGDNGKPVYTDFRIFKDFGPSAVEEMKFFAGVGTMAYGVDLARAFKIPSFMTVWGKKFSLQNQDLVDFIYEKGHEMLSLRLAAIIADEILEKNVRVNGIYQDRLAHEIMHIKMGNSKLRQKELYDKKINFMYLLFRMKQHEEIGKMLGLRGWGLGNYDALVGFFKEAFSPREVRMAKELNAWLASIMRGDVPDLLPKTLEDALQVMRDKLTSLAEKHGVVLDDEDHTFNYIFSNNCRLFELTFNIMD